MPVRATMRDVATTAAVTGVVSNRIRGSPEAAGFAPEMPVPNKVDVSDLHGDDTAWKNIRGAGHAVAHARAVRSTPKS